MIGKAGMFCRRTLPFELEYLVVGGGGAGGVGILGEASGGGGGGGGVISGSITLQPVNYTFNVVVAATKNTGNGNSSTFGEYVAIGGGAGGTTPQAGSSGGSGGGGAGGRQSTAGGAATAGQGNAGSAGFVTSGGIEIGGGGGGAGGAATNANGGPGVASSITGSSITYGVGGGGGAYGRGEGQITGGLGGDADSFGNGGSWDSESPFGGPGISGRQNRGNGGGGAAAGDSGENVNAGVAQSGVVIVAYPDTYPEISTTGTLSYTQPERAGYRVYRFTFGSGTVTLPLGVDSGEPINGGGGGGGSTTGYSVSGSTEREDANGTYCPDGSTFNSRPVYENANGWHLFWADSEAEEFAGWVLRDDVPTNDASEGNGWSYVYYGSTGDVPNTGTYGGFLQGDDVTVSETTCP